MIFMWKAITVLILMFSLSQCQADNEDPVAIVEDAKAGEETLNLEHTPEGGEKKVYLGALKIFEVCVC